MDHTHIRTYFLIIVTTLLGVLTVYMLRPFLVTLGLAMVFAVIFDPLCTRLTRGKVSRGVAAFFTLLLGLICIAVPLTFLGVQLFKEAENVYVYISQPGSVANAQVALSHLGTSLNQSIPGAGNYLANASANLSVYVRSALGYSLSHAAVVFSGTLAFVLQFFIFLITLFYLLKEGPRLATSISKYSPLNELETRTLVNRMVTTINSVVKGSLIIAIIQGALTAIGFLIFGIANPLLWGTIAIIGALIPSVGTALVFIPGVLYLFFTGHTGHAVGLGIYGLFGVGMIDNFLRPYLVGGRASIHPVLILLSVLGGLSIFGPAGLFLGPLIISLLLGLLSFYNVSGNKV